MRKISLLPIVQFSCLVAIEAGTSVVVTSRFVMPQVVSDFRGIVAIVFGVFLFYGLAIIAFRLLQAVAPVPVGDIAQHTIGERRAFLYTLHYLILFNPLIFSRTMPVPFMRLILRSLGAKMGSNSYCSGIMMDPQFVTMGRDSLIGNSAMLVPHVIEGQRLGFFPIKIGDRVTIGARAIIMAGVEIEDDATVAIQAVVSKGTRIPAGETWGGTPARRLQRLDSVEPNDKKEATHGVASLDN